MGCSLTFISYRGLCPRVSQFQTGIPRAQPERIPFPQTGIPKAQARAYPHGHSGKTRGFTRRKAAWNDGLKGGGSMTLLSYRGRSPSVSHLRMTKAGADKISPRPMSNRIFTSLSDTDMQCGIPLPVIPRRFLIKWAFQPVSASFVPNVAESNGLN